MAAALDELDGDDALQVGVLTGAGGSFCAGMDLKAFVAGERPHVEGRGFAGIAQRPPRKPLIAAVEGYALAGGFEVALSCDLIVAARDARFGIPEVKRGLVAAGGALLRLPRRIPYHLAMELALTGDPIGAERAHAVGLVNRLDRAGPGASTPRSSWPRRSPPTARWRSTRRSSIVSRRPDWTEERGVGASRPRSPRRSSPPRTPARARRRSPRSARRCGAAADRSHIRPKLCIMEISRLPCRIWSRALVDLSS